MKTSGGSNVTTLAGKLGPAELQGRRFAAGDARGSRSGHRGPAIDPTDRNNSASQCHQEPQARGLIRRSAAVPAHRLGTSLQLEPAAVVEEEQAKEAPGHDGKVKRAPVQHSRTFIKQNGRAEDHCGTLRGSSGCVFEEFRHFGDRYPSLVP